MGKTKAVSDEEIIAALLDSGTVKEAAAKTGLTARTIYDRMSKDEFQAAYSSAKADIVRQAVFSINGKLSAAIDAVADIMNDTSINAAVRLQAAQTILNNAGKFSDRLNADESRTAKYTNPFDPLGKFFC
jgi:hypothetical protein